MLARHVHFPDDEAAMTTRCPGHRPVFSSTKEASAMVREPPSRRSSSPSKLSAGRASKVHAAFAVVVGLGLAAGGSGCVREEQYQEVLRDLQRLRLEQSALKDRLIVLDREIASLRGKILERDRRLAEDTLVHAELMKRIDEASLINAELSERLRKAGQSVKDLSGERTELSKALAETRVKLEEMAKKQAAAEARLAQLKDLAKKLDRPSAEGRASTVMRRGQAMIEIPADHLFAAGKSQLTAAGKITLGEIARALKALPGRRFQVAAHTDDVKTDKARGANPWELSSARAVEVTKALLAQGMDPATLSAAGFADSTPAAPNDTEENRKKNRRIEIVLVPTAEEMVSLPGAPEPGADAVKK